MLLWLSDIRRERETRMSKYNHQHRYRISSTRQMNRWALAPQARYASSNARDSDPDLIIEERGAAAQLATGEEAGLRAPATMVGMREGHIVKS